MTGVRVRSRMYAVRPQPKRATCAAPRLSHATVLRLIRDRFPHARGWPLLGAAAGLCQPVDDGRGTAGVAFGGGGYGRILVAMSQAFLQPGMTRSSASG